MVKEIAPDMEVHVSTQAGIVNYVTANEFYNMGASCVVTARELSMTEIAEIRAKVPKDLEIECFVHGAMCISYSGRCLMSNYLTSREGNRGECAQPCRLPYCNKYPLSASAGGGFCFSNSAWNRSHFYLALQTASHMIYSVQRYRNIIQGERS